MNEGAVSAFVCQIEFDEITVVSPLFNFNFLKNVIEVDQLSLKV